MKHVDEIYRGARLALRLGSMEKVIDYFEILRLNDISANTWIRGNNSGNSACYNKMIEKSNKAYAKAKKIAVENGWKIDTAGGLYWEISDTKGKIE